MLDRVQKSTALLTAVLLAFSPLSTAQEAKPQAEPAQPSASAQASAPAKASPTVVKHTADGKPILEEGTPVRMRITRTISSADAKTGDRVDFEVLDAIKLGDVEVIPQGGIAWGTVTEAQAKRRMGRGGKLDVNIDSVRLANGDKAGLRAVKESKGGGHQGAMTGAMVATGIVFFPAAPLFLFIKGKDITVPKGTEITAYINSDTPFTAPPAAATPPAAAPAPTPAPVATTAELEISSTPDGADIEIDGAFNGSTPSTVTLAPGDHAIAVKKSGYETWERKMHVNLGRVTLKADLQPAAKDQSPKQ